MGWLVLGCGAIGRAAVETLATHVRDLMVIDQDRETIEYLHDHGIAAERSDPTNPTVLAAITGTDPMVLVASDDPAENVVIAAAAREALPDARITAYAPPEANIELLEGLADHVIAYGPTVANGLEARITGETGERLRGLAHELRSLDGPLGVFMHDNPDPDAIGSAIALRDIADAFGVDAQACYYGEIAHQENRALVNLLELDLHNPDPTSELEFAGYALVDHSRPGVHDQLPEDTPIDIVIDHHPPRGPVEAKFIDIRTDAGATSTLLVDYLTNLGIPIQPSTATGLLYGIRVDTREFSRGVSESDFEAAASLLPLADTGVLERVENPSITGETLETLAKAITNRDQRGPILVAFVGVINDRDALAQAAESLLTMEGVSTTLVYGIKDGIVYISARTRGSDLDIGEAMREAFDSIGSAGGHEEMAGAQISLGILGQFEDEVESLSRIVSDVISHRFFEVVDHSPRPQGMPLESVWHEEPSG